MPKDLVSSGETAADVCVGACGHFFCVDCGLGAATSGLAELAGLGGPRQAVGAATVAGVLSTYPGLLCLSCLGSEEERRRYSRAFAFACVGGTLPSPDLLAITAAVAPDVATWRHVTARHGLPPGWVSPEAMQQIAEAAVAFAAAGGEASAIPAALLAVYERGAVAAGLMVASQLRQADQPAAAKVRRDGSAGIADDDPFPLPAVVAVAGSSIFTPSAVAGAFPLIPAGSSNATDSAAVGGAGAAPAASLAATAAPRAAAMMQRQASSVRPVTCPNDACSQMLAIE